MTKNLEQVERAGNCPYRRNLFARIACRALDIDLYPRAALFSEGRKKYIIYDRGEVTNKVPGGTIEGCAARAIVVGKDDFSVKRTVCGACSRKITVSRIK